MPRLLAGIHPGDPVPLGEHLARHGPLPPGLWRRAPGLIELVEASGLRGRGGGWFPAGDKLRAVASQRGQPVVVVNALEGEPVSGKDKALVRHAPHLVLDGAVAAAAALGARRAIVALSEDAGPEQQAIASAIAARERAGADEGVSLSLARVPAGFVSGEETALIHFLNGGPAKPTARPPLPFRRGVGGAPTLVQNAETAAHLALIARRGPRWFRAVGTEAEPGSALVTLSGAVRNPGVFEVSLGTALSSVVGRAGGVSERPAAVLVGGYFGTWVAAARAASLTLSEVELRHAGARLGAGAITLLPASACGVAESARVARYLAAESAGQCGPCVHGLAAVADSLERLAGGQHAVTAHNGGAHELVRLLGLSEGRGACRHPDGAVRFVRSALEVFATEVELHLRGKRCDLGASELLPVPRRGRR
jgi:NADH:ubiquinone oxidoreductase subunit F (NADH-binding)